MFLPMKAILYCNNCMISKHNTVYINSFCPNCCCFTMLDPEADLANEPAGDPNFHAPS